MLPPYEKRCKMKYKLQLSERTVMTIAAETVLRENAIGKV
jgi:hypothetical protein